MYSLPRFEKITKFKYIRLSMVFCSLIDGTGDVVGIGEDFLGIGAEKYGVESREGS